MQWIDNMIFLAILSLAIYFFSKSIVRIKRNIALGIPLNRSDNPGQRWKVMAKVALGQSKMVSRPIAGFFHILIYLGFVLINIEVLEILIDGIFGTHRIFSKPLGQLYHFAINFFEILALGVIIACIVFLVRRNLAKVSRFHKPEMVGWPTRDANLILYIELVLMFAFLLMNAVEANFEDNHMGPFVVSGFFSGIFESWSQSRLHFAERVFWWFHIIGILAFLNYLPFSKHFHIVLSFPNVWFSNLNQKGKFENMSAVTEEVKKMIDPNSNPYDSSNTSTEVPSRFGAKDVFDLNWVQLLNAYTCTECGRCTSVCPANQTGKKLSPRKIMMDVRDRLEEVGRIIDTKGKFEEDGKFLLDGYISREELWACTTCNACVEACPVNIDPLSIIMEMRRYLVMEESAAPQELNLMMQNIENNAAPWQFAQADRLNWVED